MKLPLLELGGFTFYLRFIFNRLWIRCLTKYGSLQPQGAWLLGILEKYTVRMNKQ